MPSFDVISDVDKHELTNAIDQANRELANRFDFKGTDASFELDKLVVKVQAPGEFQLQQMQDILRARLVARKIDARCLDIADPEVNLAGAPADHREAGHRAGGVEEDHRGAERGQDQGRGADQRRQAARQRQEA